MSDEGFSFGGEEVHALVNLLHKYTLVPADRLFAPINDFLIILASISHAASVMVGGETHTIHNPVMRLNSKVLQKSYALPLGGALQMALQQKTPNKIEIGVVAFSTKELPKTKLQTHGLDQVIHHIVSPIFIVFFERYNDWLTQKYGDAVNWPMTLNFCRVVRNAIAHGKIDIRNPNSPAVTWQNLSYDYSSKGTKIIGTDLRVGDIFGLMFEANDDLDKLKAPVL